MDDVTRAHSARHVWIELDQWDEPSFARYAATLRRHHPSAGEYVFQGLAASTGIEAVAGISTLVTVALGPTAPLETPADAIAARKSARTEALTALKDWYDEWASTARAVVKKRAYLIRMGLASRKPPKKAGAGGKGEDPTGRGAPA